MSKILDTFTNICHTKPEKIAIIYHQHGKVTKKKFSQLFQDVRNASEYMKTCGVKKGDRILAFAKSSYALCVFMFATLTLGASVMYVDIFAKQEKLRNIFKDYSPAFILVCNKTKHLRFFFGEIGKIKCIINTDNVQKCNTTNGEFSCENIPEDTLALLTMTTGSTGKPKVVLRTHADLFNQLQLIHSNLDSCTPDEIVLTTSYIYVFANILNGFTTVLPQLNLNASNKKICRILSRFSCIPITMIITSPDFCLKADNIFPALKTLYFGGAILNLNEAERILTKFQYSKNYVIYGSTECSIMCKIQLEKYVRILKQTGHAPLGAPVNGVDISLTDEGEITVSSCALLEEYLISDSRTKIKDENGTLRHRTGDMAQFENGYYYYLGKNKYFIIRNNEKIYCNQLEQKIITALPLIPKCAVVEMQNRTFIVVEKCEISNDTDFKTNVRNACGINDACIIKIRKIPCDIKHHTKINYEKLKKWLKKYDKL